MIRRVLRSLGWVPRWEYEATLKWAEHLHAERNYWREKAERIIDAALVRQGATHQPTMAPAPKPQPNPMHDMMRALSITEIDSSKRKGDAAS